MKVLGFLSWVVSAIMFFTGFDIYNNATTIMQQGVGMDHFMYSGIMFVAGAICITARKDVNYQVTLDSIDRKLYELNK